MENQVIITNIESYLTTDSEIFFEINNHDGSLKIYVINTENIYGLKYYLIEEIIVRGGVEY